MAGNKKGHRVKKIILLILSVLVVGVCNMRNLYAARTLTLENCIQKALNTHPDIKRFVLQIRHGKEEIKAAKADYLPQMTVNAEYDPTKTYVMSANGIFRTQNSDGWQAGAALKQKIWDFSRTSSLIKAKEAQEKTEHLSLQEAKALLAYRVKLQYELALVQQKAISVRQNDLQAKQALYRQAKALVKQGMKTRADETRFMSSVYVSKDNLSIADSNLAKAETILSLYIGEPVPKGTKFQTNIIKSGNDLKDEKRMLRNSPALQGLKINIKKSKFLWKAAKASHYGSVDAVVSYVYQDTLNTYDSLMAGIMFTIPLYSGGRISAVEQQAAIDRQIAENEYNAKVLSLKEEFQTLIIDLKRCENTIKARSSQLKAARQTEIVVNGRYKEGLATYMEVLDARALTLDARLGLLQAGYDKSSTIHRLEYLQGTVK